MPERKASVDSFDDFFGDAKPAAQRKKSPVKPKENESAVAAMIRTQPIVRRSPTPPTPREQRTPSPKVKPKVEPAKPAVKANAHRSPSPPMPKRPESSKSKTYESDFDDDNGYEDEDDTVLDGPYNRKEHSSLPPPKQRTLNAPRRGSDSELKKSFVVTPQKKRKADTTQRKEPILPTIRAPLPRRAVQPSRSLRDNASASSKNEVEQRLLSAHNNKVKSLESRLAELRHQLDAQRSENATLRTIQKREEKAIRGYEEKEFDVHRIVQYYTKEVEHIKRVLSTERETKARLEKQIEARDEKLQDQTKRLKQYEKVVHEKHLDERYELREKLNETDKRLQDLQEKLNQQQKYIDNLEKNHRHEVNQELNKQRDLKRELDGRSKKYNELLAKFEEKTRHSETMHIYAQRGGVRPSDSPAALPKSRSLQSLNEPSPRGREKTIDLDRKKREPPPEPERKPKARPQPPPAVSNDSSPKSEKKKPVVKKEPPPPATTMKTTAPAAKPAPTTQNGHLPPKGKPPARRLSTPRSVDEDESDFDGDAFFPASPKKLPPPASNQRSNQHPPNTDSQKRPAAPAPTENASKYKSSGAGGGTTAAPAAPAAPPAAKPANPPPPPPSKPRVTRELDEKWSDMFATPKQDNAAKEDLLAKLVADEQQERKMNTTSRAPPARSSTTTTTTTTAHPPATTTTTNTRPVADPFESLFSTNSSKPPASRRTDPDDIFSSKPASQPARQSKNDSFEALFGPSTTATNSKQPPSQNDRLQRPKLVTNATRSIPNRTIFDEVEEFA